MWTDQRTPRRCGPGTPVVVGTNRHGSSAGGTDRLERSVLLQATWATNSPPPDGTNPGLVTTDPPGSMEPSLGTSFSHPARTLTLTTKSISDHVKKKTIAKLVLFCKSILRMSHFFNFAQPVMFFFKMKTTIGHVPFGALNNVK
jgi:hypothetical protein